jgi:hypothetical protein
VPYPDHDLLKTSERSSQVILPNAVFAGETSSSWIHDDHKVAVLDASRTWKENTETEVSISSTPLSSRRTFTNRHARLIDGAIFTAKHRGLIDPIGRGDKKHHGDAKRSVARSSWSAARQKESLRHSLIHGVRSIFRKDQQSQQQHQPSSDRNNHKRDSSLLHNAFDPHSDMISPQATLATSPSYHLSTSHTYNHFWGLDGACDEESGLPRPSLNLNKPLPVSPGNLGTRTSSSRTGTPLSERFHETPIRPSTASSVSSNLSTASSKRDFRGLTRALINEEMGPRRPDLSPVREAETLFPIKYDPRTSSVYS